MKLVIEIDEKEYNDITPFLNGEKIEGGFNLFKALRIIKYGTPLPKGHGRLKDADAICKDIISALGIHDENYLYEAEKAVYKRIKNASTIIEADKRGSEE